MRLAFFFLYNFSSCCIFVSCFAFVLFCFVSLHCYCFCSCHRVVLHVLPGAACGMVYLLNYILYVNWQQQVCLCSLFVFHFHFFFLCFYGFSCLFTMLSVKLWLMLVFGMETYQCIGISHISEKRETERATRLAANQYRVYSQVFSKSVYLLLNYLPKLQFVAFISISFNLIWTFACCHVAMKPFWHYDVAIKDADFPPCCIFTAATRVASLFFIISLLLCQICQAFWWGESLANTRCGKYFIWLRECRNC